MFYKLFKTISFTCFIEVQNSEWNENTFDWNPADRLCLGSKFTPRAEWVKNLYIDC